MKHKFDRDFLITLAGITLILGVFIGSSIIQSI